MAQKLNDYTLHESTSIVSKNDGDWYRESNISREFNFLSRQRTTTVEFVIWDKKTKNTSTSVAVSIDNFRDIEGQDEIIRAHRALVSLGGKPPPLDDVLGNITKKSLPSPR